MGETASFVSIKDFCQRSGLSRGTVYNMVARDEIAKPVRLTKNRVALPAPAVEAWFASRVEAS
jgi:predicted DNA-binding transcriptional regulator AlpA